MVFFHCSKKKSKKSKKKKRRESSDESDSDSDSESEEEIGEMRWVEKSAKSKSSIHIIGQVGVVLQYLQYYYLSNCNVLLCKYAGGRNLVNDVMKFKKIFVFSRTC